ncbi:hypothetical protein J6U32_09225 [Gordonia polyisoprenivorans]|nr:hypothetical protein J6U32_09225 [Gordonia polyisoprenivorans]
MIRYAVSWLPFGSGDEYIFPEFGITPAVFYHRIVLFIAAGYVDFLDSYTRDELRTFCTRKIALSKGESHVASLAG